MNKKQKTWMFSALMYAFVFVVCFGVLHILREWTEPTYTEETVSRIEESLVDPVTEETEKSEKKQGILPEEESKEEETAAEELRYPRKKIRRAWKEVLPPPQEEPYRPPRIILATDLHYQSHKMDDGGEAFRKFVKECDGKVVQYLPELMDAFIEQVIREQPDALVLSGDITMNGEKVNHQELSQKLSKVRDAGIPVVVIPGNHDINNLHAALYTGEEKTAADSVTPQEFYELYRTFGYDQAVSRDPASLSYLFRLDEKNSLLMLDTCQYEPYNLVEGMIREETLSWAEEELKKAAEEGIFVLPVGHHNLLAQSRMYTTQCALENQDEAIRLFQEYRLPLYLSGHLHVQRVRRHKAEPGADDREYGITEIITDALSIPPCQYGVLEWKDDGSIEYATESVDVEGWAKENRIEDENLLNFRKWSSGYIEDLIAAQLRRIVKPLGERVERSMAAFYAETYIDYYAGCRIDPKEARRCQGYFWWQRNLSDSVQMRELEAMITDADQDYNTYRIPAASEDSEG